MTFISPVSDDGNEIAITAQVNLHSSYSIREIIFFIYFMAETLFYYETKTKFDFYFIDEIKFYENVYRILVDHVDYNLECNMALY